MSFNTNRDSFTRFDDTLCVTIFEFLSIEQKLQFESVSKHWKFWIFDRLSALTLRRTGNQCKLFDNLENILKKCKSITRLTIEFDHEMVNNNDAVLDVIEDLNLILDLISKYTRNLKMFCVKTNNLFEMKVGKSLEKFSEKLGRRLRSIAIQGFGIKQMTGLLRRSPNARSVIYEAILVFNSSNLPNYLQNLVNIQFNEFTTQQFIAFTDKYFKQIRRIGFILKTGDDFESISKQITRFKILDKLSIDLRVSINTSQLNRIANGCQQLKCFAVDFSSSESYPFDCDIFPAFSQFKSLEKLVINYSSDKDIIWEIDCGNITHLSRLKNLNYLSIASTAYVFMHLKNIHKIIPKLQVLKVGKMNGREMSVNDLEHLSKLKNLSELEIIAKRDDNEDDFSEYAHLINMLPNLKSFCINEISDYGYFFTNLFLGGLVRSASLNPRITITAKLGVNYNHYKQLFQSDNGLPDNLFFEHNSHYENTNKIANDDNDDENLVHLNDDEEDVYDIKSLQKFKNYGDLDPVFRYIAHPFDDVEELDIQRNREIFNSFEPHIKEQLNRISFNGRAGSIFSPDVKSDRKPCEENNRLPRNLAFGLNNIFKNINRITNDDKDDNTDYYDNEEKDYNAFIAQWVPNSDDSDEGVMDADDEEDDERRRLNDKFMPKFW